MKRITPKWLIFSLLIVITLAGCSTSSTMLPTNNSLNVVSGSSFGQSFTAQNKGLSGVLILLAPSSDQSEGSLLFHLRASAGSADDIAVARLPISEITRQAYYKFDFPPQSDSQRKDYFLTVDVEGGGQVIIFTAPGESYLDGALYANQNPQDAQLGFQLQYDRLAYILGLAQTVAEWILTLVIGLVLFVLPGWGLFSLLWPGWDDVNWCSKLGLSAGLSLAIYPLFMLWTNLVGLHLGLLYALLPPAAGLLGLVWKYRKHLCRCTSLLQSKNKLSTQRQLPSAETILVDISFIIILGLVIATRFWEIRSLDVPLFGDSYQHTMITQLIIDRRGLFNSWQPYADLVTFTYHFGFHSAVAVYHWISGANVEKAMLWTGQLINIIAILGLYPLTYKITKNRWAGVTAMLIAGLLSPMPNYYVNWGRYTQLAGQAVLPVAIWIAWSILERPHDESVQLPWIGKLASRQHLSLDLGSLAVAWMALAGLALAHYRILILAVLFFLAYGLFSLARKQFISWLGKTAWIGIGGAVLFLPWFIHAFGGKIIKMFAAQITTLPSAVNKSTELINSIGNIQTYLPVYIWIILLICLIWGLWQWKKDLPIFIIWWFLIILATNPNWFNLPGTGVITNFAVLIAFYIPAGVVIGSAVAGILQKLQKEDGSIPVSTRNNRSKLVINSAVLIIICCLGLWGSRSRAKELNPLSFALVTRPDLRAMTWIRENLPTDADFLVNSFFAYNNSVVVGSDGGWWIPILASRKTTLPPLTYGFELGVGSATTTSANSLTREIQDKGISNPDISSLLLEQGVRYVYIGQRQGTVNYSGPQILDPALMTTIPNFKAVYHQDRVWIFEVMP